MLTTISLIPVILTIMFVILLLVIKKELRHMASNIK